MQDTAEVRQLALHPLAIHTFIKAQAGTLAKALSEAVMNSIDASASAVHITLTNKGFTVEDDGQGFKNREEIAAWFETLGFPHDEGNHRVFGKFGMGRAQMWAFARTKWTSNHFVMDVDVQKKGLNYHLDETVSPFKGTRIVAEYYTPLDNTELTRTTSELKELVRYAAGLVTLNGSVINQNPELEDWTLETDDAWFKLEPRGHSLTLYNAGVFVTNFSRYQYKLAGLIVTKPHVTLSLNLARNSVLTAECAVWKRIVKVLNQHQQEDAPKKTKPTKLPESELAAWGQKFASGECSLQKTLSRAPDLLTNVYGRKVAFGSLASTFRRPSAVVFVAKGDSLGKRLSKLNMALALDKDVLTRLGGVTIEQLKERLRTEVKEQYESYKYEAVYVNRCLEQFDQEPWSDDPVSLFKDFAQGKSRILDSELTVNEKAVARALQRSSSAILGALAECKNEAVREYLKPACAIKLGDSPTDRVWVDTEGKYLILRKKDVVKAMEALSLGTLFKYLNTVVLDIAKQGANGDTEVANEVFIDWMCNTDLSNQLCIGLTHQYTHACLNYNVEREVRTIRRVPEVVDET